MAELPPSQAEEQVETSGRRHLETGCGVYGLAWSPAFEGCFSVHEGGTF